MLIVFSTIYGSNSISLQPHPNEHGTYALFNVVSYMVSFELLFDKYYYMKILTATYDGPIAHKVQGTNPKAYFLGYDLFGFDCSSIFGERSCKGTTFPQ